MTYRDVDAIKDLLKGTDRIRTLSDVHRNPHPYAVIDPVQETKVLYSGPSGSYIVQSMFHVFGAPEERILALPANLEPDSYLSYESEHLNNYSPWYEMIRID